MSMISLAQFEPAELGLPDKFASFRPAQIEAIEHALNSDNRFVGLALPTGAGKSLVAMALAKASGMRTVILTGTKGLQQQYLDDFESCGLTDVRGKANYQCFGVPLDFHSWPPTGVSCRFGPHEKCRYAGTPGCNYERARWRAKNAEIVLTNYAYWIRVNEKTRGLELTMKEGGPNPVELLILDEAHDAVEQLSQALKVVVRETWLHTAHLKTDGLNDTVTEWAFAAGAASTHVDQQLKEAIAILRHKPVETNRDRVYRLEELSEALDRISWMTSENWVCEMKDGTNWGRVWEFDCVWPGQHAESSLFLRVPKVVLMSATLRPAVFQMLGVDKEEYDFREWPRIFPANRTPVYHIRTVRVNHRMTEEQLQQWMDTIDEIITSRTERKGIIHTVSYARQKYLLDRSRHSGIMVANTSEPESESAAQVVARFKRMGAPAVLVSPSFSTGWDFPGRECEWEIIAKVPFPDSRSKVMQARKQKSARYLNYLAMQDLVQACGRGSRYEKDRCEIFVCDDNIGWFLYQNRGLAPQWFDVIRVAGVPPPGPRVEVA